MSTLSNIISNSAGVLLQDKIINNIDLITAIVPTNSRIAIIEGWGAGGGVPAGSFVGGWGGYCKLTSYVLPEEWLTSLTGTIGTGGASSDPGADGTNSTFTGTLNGVAISLIAGKGLGGSSSEDGGAGSASGGDINLGGLNYSQPMVVPGHNAGYGGSNAPDSLGLAGGDGLWRVRYYS